VGIFDPDEVITIYSIREAVRRGVLVEVFKRSWEWLSGGKPVVASSSRTSDGWREHDVGGHWADDVRIVGDTERAGVTAPAIGPTWWRSTRAAGGDYRPAQLGAQQPGRFVRSQPQLHLQLQARFRHLFYTSFARNISCCRSQRDKLSLCLCDPDPRASYSNPGENSGPGSERYQLAPPERARVAARN
jgi:hypothetical protein